MTKSGAGSMELALGGALCAASAAALSYYATSKRPATVASDVEFLLSRAQALQQAEGTRGPIKLETILVAMKETGASNMVPGGGATPPAAPPPPSDSLTKKELEETMKSMLGPPGMQSDESALERFTTDLTQSARYGKLDPVIGRDEEVRRCIHILSRRTKNSPVLIGECGVGKTAIVEALAQRIVAGDVPMSLMNTKILELDLGSLTAGCMMPGEFEERLKAVLNEVAALGSRAILFIDDIHNLVPAMGGQGGSMMDGGALLKPALSRGELRCIGCSGIDKFKKTIEKDAALERRFQQVFVAQPSVDQTISILRGLRARYEGYHNTDITESALVASAAMAARYIQGRFLPDKAIDLMDEATSQVKMEMTLKPEALDNIDRMVGQLEMEERSLKRKATNDKVAADYLAEIELKLLELKEQKAEVLSAQKSGQEKEAAKVDMSAMITISSEIVSLQAEAEEADKEGDAETACELKTRISVLEGDLQEMRKVAMMSNGWKNAQKRAEVQEGDVAKVISRWTGIPVTKLVASEKEKLLHLTDELHKRIIGQEEAVEAVAEAIQRSRADLVDPNGPISSFMFLGPTGVGKTELAKALAANLFNSEDALVRLDMSEYMEKHAVSRLIGAPPGYVGYDEGGLLTDAVRRRPYSVVLFDEIEKAHVDVFNILLQILDDGRVTDTQGHVVSFKNTLIIMTSNLGSAEIFEMPGSSKELLKEKVMEHVKAHFRPEFINRVDDFITFEPLKPAQINQIVVLRAQRLVASMAEKRMHLQLEDSAVERIAEVGYDPMYGARPVKRALQRELQTVLAKALLRGEFDEDDSVIVRADPNGTGLTLTKGPKVENPATVRIAELKAKAQKAAEEAIAAAAAADADAAAAADMNGGGADQPKPDSNGHVNDEPKGQSQGTQNVDSNGH